LSRLVLKNLKPQLLNVAPRLSNLSAAKFSNEWRPTIPKHEYQLDGTSYSMVHPKWDATDIQDVELTHYEPRTFGDRFALYSCKAMRKVFDLITLYNYGQMTEERYIRRFVCHGVVAAVPGMIGAMLRHMKSLSIMRIDGGWIHHMLEEAENQRVHLFTCMDIQKPNFILRAGFLCVQAMFIASYALLYFCSPRVAHRFVGYMKEQSIRTYSHAIKDMKEGKLKQWDTLAAPKVARRYWNMGEDAKFKDVLYYIRADEILHREINHHFADMKKSEPMPRLNKIAKISGTESNSKTV